MRILTLCLVVSELTGNSQGGLITHKYTIIKGFAAEVSATTLEKVEAMNAQFPAIIEEDGIASTNNEKTGAV